ncbi:hypothetical protein PN36_09800 [Candidatus Thiomargarita nelsonii]|uniref:Uncharacterized protein n=1 Tax=Candidatus Thiomargarita nelsonii TaxID=1003181 RepID=A0A4E0QQM0_9GAMM|nr:hypothetical protein PN36_09800 [Candidatus Thiomargarita nelsonii]
MINDALRDYIQHYKEPVENTLRRVIRQELQVVGLFVRIAIGITTFNRLVPNKKCHFFKKWHF